MNKSTLRLCLLLACALALPCVEPAYAGAPKPAAAAKARPARSADQSAAKQAPAPAPTPAPAAPTQMELARKYSPIKYCHGASYPAATWMQVREFLDKHAPSQSSSPDSTAPRAATDAAISTIPKLEYPESLRASAMDGSAAVLVAVTKEGTAADALVVCSNHAAFSEAALVAVKAATFVPATRDGKPVESVATLPIDFHP